MAGFVCPDPAVGAYFGPRIFAGTPFEQAPVLAAKIEVRVEAPQQVSARVEVGGHVLETRLSALGAVEGIQRDPIATAPFVQQGLEAVAGRAQLFVDGVEVAIHLPPHGPTGGAPAVWAPAGVYAR